MHTATVPVEVPQWLAMPVNRDTIFFANSFKQVAGYPYFITSLLGSFCENLKFPLTGCYFSIYTFHVKTCIETRVKMFFNNCATISILCPNGTIVRTLWSWKTSFRETNRAVRFRIP